MSGSYRNRHLAVEVGFDMGDSAYAQQYLPVRTEKPIGIELFFKTGQRQVDDMVFSLVRHGGRHLVYRIEIGDLLDLQSAEFIDAGNEEAGAKTLFSALQRIEQRI